MKKTLFTLVLVLAGGGFAYWRFGLTAEPPQFRTLPITRGNIEIGVTATGNVEAVQVIDVGAQIVGMVKSFGPDRDNPGATIDYNSHVRKGDVLAQLDDRPHRLELDKAVAGLRMAEAEAAESRAHRDQAESNFHRAERLKKVNSPADYEAAAAQFEIAKAEVALSEAKVEQARCMKKGAEINLDYTTIRSPVDGTVISRRVNVGQTVVAGFNAPSLFLLAKDLSHMRVYAEVNEADIGDVHVGQKATFKVDKCRERKFVGKVSQIRLDAAMVSGVVTYGVVVDVDNSDGALMPYMTAKLQFDVDHRTNVLLIPNQALRWRPTWNQISPSARSGLKPPAARSSRPEDQDEGQIDDEPTVETATPTAWVRGEDGLVRPVPVKPGLSDGMVTELAGGELHLKDEVVIQAVRAAKPDFVSSFVNKVIKK